MHRRILILGITLLVIASGVGVARLVYAAHCPPLEIFEPCDDHADVWDECPLGQNGSYSITITSPAEGQNVGTSVNVSYSSSAGPGAPKHHTDIIAAGVRYAGLPPTGSQTVSLTGSNDVIYAEIYCAYNHIAASTQITVNTAPTPTPPTPTPSPTNNAAFVSYGGPTSVAANQVFSVPLTMRNTGTTTWDIGSNYKLGALNAFWGIGRATWSSVNGAPSVGPVPPGATATFVFNATAPASPGTYAMAWQMLIEGVAWFGEATPPTVTVANALPEGLHDGLVCDGFGSWGWARDADNAPAAIPVHIYRDGPVGGGGILTAILTANQFRSTVPYPDKNHGFSFVVPPALHDGLPHSYYVYAINTPLGANPMLTGSPRTLTCYQPPAITISAAPNPVAYNSPSIVTWSVANPAGTVCTGSGGTTGPDGAWAGPRTTGGVFDTGPMTVPRVFTLSCTNPGGTDVESVTVNVIPPAPPQVSITSIDQPDYCANGPQATVNWTYFSPSGLPQAQWRVRAYTDALLSIPVYDSGTRAGATTSMSTGPGPWFTYNETYYVRLEVWDTAGGTAQDVLPFTTPPTAYPLVDFTVTPAQPIALQNTLFTDTSSYGGSDPTMREWTFGDGVVDQQFPGSPTITHMYMTSTPVTVTLRVSNDVTGPGESCSASKDLNVQKPIPNYKEVRPGTAPADGDTETP